MNITAPLSSERASLAAASWVLLFVWLAGSVTAFWYMDMRDWRSFSRDDAVFDGIDATRVEQWYRTAGTPVDHPQVGALAKLTFIHLYDPACRCNRFIEPHLQRLMQHYQSLGVQFVAAPARSAAAEELPPFGLPALRTNRSALAAAGVLSSPAALIFDADGRLLYYGPYSDSAWCGSTGTLVEPVLDRALSGLAIVRRPRPSRGCFCGW